MYTLVSAIAKPLNPGGRWANVAIGDVPLEQIFATYSHVYTILSNPFLPTQVCLDFANITQYSGLNLTFNQWLASIGPMTLPTSNTLPQINTRYAQYADAFHAGYTITPVHPTAAPDAAMPAGDKTWLKLTRANTDYSLFYKSCLVNVNGFFHATDMDSTGVYVQDGMRSQQLCGQNQIGLLSFNGIGSLTCVPITSSMLYKANAGDLYQNRCYVDLGQDVSQKTVMLVLGGYLHVLDSRTFFRVAASRFCISFQNLPLFERYYESSPYIDLSSLNLPTTPVNAKQIGVSDLLSDATLTAYLTLSQSFFVILDNTDIFVDKQGIHTTRIPGMYIAYTPPLYPMVVGFGRLANYWYTYEDGQYSLTTGDAFLPNPVYRTVNPYVQTCISDNRIPENPGQNSPAYFLQIGCDM